MTFESMAEYLNDKFWNRLFASVGVVPVARAVPLSKQMDYEVHVREQVVHMGVMHAMPAIKDPEGAYSEQASRAGDCHGKLYREGRKAPKVHVRRQAHRFLCASICLSSIDLVLVIGWNSENPSREYRMQSEFCASHFEH